MNVIKNTNRDSMLEFKHNFLTYIEGIFMKQFKNAIFLFTFALLSFFSTTTHAAVQDQSVAGTNGIVNFQLNYTGLPNFARIFVDADQNKNTGFNVKGIIGAEFLIENDALYRYSGTGQDWNWSSHSNCSRTTRIIGAS